jgi:dipeptidyl aminopeptidase/acylaminoacyl peptidase
MKRTMLLLFVICVMATGAAAENLSYLDKLPPIIDREVFFGDPEIAGGQISPDGKYISFLKQYKGYLNIWVKERDEKFEKAVPVTADTVRSVRGYTWTRDGRFIIYVQDKGGDENFHIYAVDPYVKPAPGQDVPEARDLTPMEGIRAFFYSLPENEPDIIYCGLNDRDERYHDLYRLAISTGELMLVRQNDEGFSRWIFDLEGNLRLSTKEMDDGGTEIFRIDGDGFESIYTCTVDETAEPMRFHIDGARFYMITNKGEGHDLTSLVLFNPETLEEEYVDSDPDKRVDFGGALFSEKTEELIATYYVGDRLRIYFHNDEYKKDYEKLQKKLPKGDIYIGSATADDRYVLVSVTSDTDPGATYLFDRKKGKVELLYRPRPKLPMEHLAEMKPERYLTRDGLIISAYLTVPKGVEPKNLAVIIMPHGGPWARDYWGYDSYAQFLANRGYAVFQPNFRGSSGYGKVFLNAAKREWGDKMQDDITDGVKYLIDKGIADPNRIGIFGGSYGGYATLAGVAFTPDLYACGVDYVGVSNLLTFLNSIPAYWETARKFLNEHVGDPNDPEDMERLERQSPLFKADKIEAPLLVIQGANDPRVKKAESDQIVVAMRDLGRDVEYIIAPDEGHGFLGEKNRLAFTVAMEKFLAKHLGGRYQGEVPEDLQVHLDAITVDVSAVTLAEKRAGTEDAMSVPLPVVDASGIKPTTLVFKATTSMGGQEIVIDVTQKYEKAKLDGKPAWLIASNTTMPMGSAVDTFWVDHKTVLPIKWRVHQGPVFVDIDFSDDAVKGWIEMGAQKIPVDIALEAPIFASGSAMDLLAMALPLAEGYKVTVRFFELQMQKVRPMALEVIGTETVTVPAGTFETYKVELKPLDGEIGGGTVYVMKEGLKYPVKAKMQLPPQAGSLVVLSELVSFK